jgi:hypothetical protein
MEHDVRDVYLNQYHMIYLLMDIHPLENDLQLVSKEKNLRKKRNMYLNITGAELSFLRRILKFKKTCLLMYLRRE